MLKSVCDVYVLFYECVYQVHVTICASVYEYIHDLMSVSALCISHVRCVRVCVYLLQYFLCVSVGVCTDAFKYESVCWL